MKKSHALALIPLLMASSAMANPATQDGADHLTQVFQTYLGANQGVVTVAPNGDVYDLTMDPTSLIALGKDSGLTGTVTPLKMALTDNGDGTWAVAMDQPISIALSMPDKFDLKEDIATNKVDGTFDEKLMTFSAIKGEASGIKVSQSMTAPEGTTTAEVSVDKITLDGTGTAGASGGVDTTATVTASGLAETVNTPATEGSPSMPITIKAETLTEDFKGSGFVLDGIYKTVAWVVSHPDDKAMDAGKSELKTILTGAMPFFGNVSGTGSVSKVSVDTPIGPVALDSLAFTVDMNGAVPDGKFREGITMSGLTLPPGVVPDWAMPVLPQKIALDFQVTDFDPAGFMTTLMNGLDLPAGTEPGPDFQANLQAALLPKGNVTITLNPGAVTGDGYELTYQGDMSAGPGGAMPTGKATVTLTGADKLQAALNAAPDDIKGQAMMGFGMAQGMAKQQDGKLVWDIDASTPGSVSVNGTPLMGGN